MYFDKVIDEDTRQIYTIVNPDKKWLAKFPQKHISIIFNVHDEKVSIIKSNSIPFFELLTNYGYVFSRLSKQKILKIFGKQQPQENNPPIQRKMCGFNPSNSELLVAPYNSLLSIYSDKNTEYPLSYMSESIYALTTFDELMNMKNINESIKKIVENNLQQHKINHWIDFVKELKMFFPMNYGGTVRKFGKRIDKKEIKNCCVLNPSTHFYLGYDCRGITTEKEIMLSHQMENIVYNLNDELINVFETYNNPLEKIKKICKENKIQFITSNKHCIKIKNKDYDNLVKYLTATISDFIA